MIKFSNIKIGDFVMGEYNGKMWEGEVTHLNGDEKQVCVQTDVQEFYFDTEHLHPIPLNDEQLIKLGFVKEEASDGSVKYKKDAFRILLAAKNDFSKMEIWYREDKRHNPDIHAVHELQNHFYDMTKMHLTKELV